MSLSIAIVGLPNVGKSTLFNALLKQQAALAANYPFATIEPNVGVVPVPDERLEKLATIVKTTVIKPATVEFVDVAGLVRGAHRGEGLGNQFLAHIRETAAIVHVLREFKNPDIIREGAVDPVADLQTVRTELQLADLATLEKQKQPKGSADPNLQRRWELIEQLKSWIEAGQNLRQQLDQLPAPAVQKEYQHLAQELNLLTTKPELFVLNVGEADINHHHSLATELAAQIKVSPSRVVVICAQIESELSSLAAADQQLYLQELGLNQSGLERLIAAAYHLLNLQSFLTAGQKEVKAWTIQQDTTAPEAAGVIHTDFAKNFIKARVVAYDDFIQYQGWKGAKAEGKIRLEGREYVMRPDDVVEFMTSA